MRAVFLDRDGVINENLDSNYVKSWDEFRFLPRSKEAIKALSDAGLNVIIITNQACIGKGIVSAHIVERINTNMMDEIMQFGGKVRALYYCPHIAEDNCECRKPKSGMLIRASQDFDISLPDSYLVGDDIKDILAGKNVGCKVILVKTGKGTKSVEQLSKLKVKPDHIVPNLFEASQIILEVFP